jgi:hypothetical protein
MLVICPRFVAVSCLDNYRPKDYRRLLHLLETLSSAGLAADHVNSIMVWIASIVHCMTHA